jgi:hypothetical protein
METLVKQGDFQEVIDSAHLSVWSHLKKSVLQFETSVGRNFKT